MAAMQTGSRYSETGPNTPNVPLKYGLVVLCRNATTMYSAGIQIRQCRSSAIRTATMSTLWFLSYP